MIKDLGVFPHNLAVCSPLFVGNHLFVVTSNGVDEGHINVPAPKAPSFIKLDKKNGKVLWQDNLPTVRLDASSQGRRSGVIFQAPRQSRRADPARPMVQPGLRQGQRHRRRSFSPAARARFILSTRTPASCSGRSIAIPRTPNMSCPARGTRSDFIATPVIYDNKVYIGVGQDPEHEFGVGHLWCIDMTKKGRRLAGNRHRLQGLPAQDQAEPEFRDGLALRRPGSQRDTAEIIYFGRTMSTCAIHDGLVLRRGIGRLYPLPRRQDRQALLVARHQARNLEFARTRRTAKSTWAPTTAPSGSSLTARRRKSWPRTTWTAPSGPRPWPPMASCT